jgi:hypothetical protein
MFIAGDTAPAAGWPGGLTPNAGDGLTFDGTSWHDVGPLSPALALDDLSDVDVHLSATGMSLIKQLDGSWKGAHVRQTLNQLSDVTAPTDTPPNSLLGTVGEGATAGQAEWEPLHLDYVQGVVLGPIPSTVADLSQRVTELEHTGEIVPADLELTVDLYGSSFTRIIGCDPITASPAQRITVALATAPGPNGAVFASLSDISGTGAVWADFGGTLGKVVDNAGTAVNGAALKEAIRRNQIITVHRGTDGTHPTLVVEKVENPADAGSSLTLDALKDVTAPATTPAGKVLGTTAEGAWGPVDPPVAAADHNIDEVVYAMTANAGIWPWGGNTWGPGSYVMHNDRLWYTATAAPSSEVPGVSSLWQDVTLAALAGDAPSGLPLTGGFVVTPDGYFLDIEGGSLSLGAPAEADDTSTTGAVAITESLLTGGVYVLHLYSGEPAKLSGPPPEEADDLVTKGYVDQAVAAGGGGGTPEVAVGPTEPTEPSVLLWVKTGA